ncbi:TPA: hypothetical protein PFE14_000460 [Kluyvera ascorbata]|nr:hypothetical protein [Kluyvera ascorbata]
MLALASASASAVTIDLRHEYTDTSQGQKDRVLISHRFANGFGFSVEAKTKSGGEHSDKAFNDVVDNGDEHVNRGDLWLGYKTGAWTFEGNYLYKKSEDYNRYNNGKDDYELDLKVAYSIDKNWKPYAQIGNVSVSSDEDDRQTRYRVGVQYTF